MTDFLFTVPNFFSGMAQVLDFGGVYDRVNVSPSREIADRRALFADFLAIGRDMVTVLAIERERAANG